MINTNYNHVWFFEDDVFFNSEETLAKIDSQYYSDLLSNTYEETKNEYKNDWLWGRIDYIFYELPFYKAMVCCVRMSSNLLCKIKEYAIKHKTLFFLEALFPTVCKKNNLVYDTPPEFNNIVFRKNYKNIDINASEIFHPVKDITKHKFYRELILMGSFQGHVKES
jgi:hypothetical protein